MHHTMQQLIPLCLLLLATAASAQQQQPQDAGEVAFAGPPAAEIAAALAADTNLTCSTPCYAVSSRYPFKQCAPSCDPAVCNRGYDAFQSQEVCCEVTFPNSGCTRRPDQCWVVESYQLRTCVRDDRKCLQGFGVFPSEAACCAPQGPANQPLAAAPGAFPEGCGNVTKAAEPCWVVDTYWPSRQCRQSRTLCGADSGVRAFQSQGACCAPQTGAFGEGCSNGTIPLPCWVVDSYYPNRSCRRSSDVAVCNRGWGVFSSEDICCAPGASFAEGCSVRSGPAADAGNTIATIPGAGPAAGAGNTTAATPPQAEAGPAAGSAGAIPQVLPVVPVVPVVTTGPLPGAAPGAGKK